MGRRLTSAEDAWLRTLWLKHSADETARMINGWFGKSFTKTQIQEAARTRKLGPAGGRAPPRPRAGSWLTPEVKAWLRQHIHERSLPGTAEELYRVFGIRIRVGQLNSANANHKFGEANRNVIRAYSAEEFAWLKENLPTAPRAVIADRFLERFGREISHSKLDNFVTRHGCRGAPNTGCFVPGDPRAGVHTHEQRAAFLKAGKKTRFKKGSVPGNVLPLYSERWSHANSGDTKRRYLEIKVPGPSHKPSLRALGTEWAGHWIGKARWVWEQANGPIPEGHVVAVLDGDEANCALENLECVPRSVIARRNAYHAPTPAPGDKDAYKATIRIAQIKEAIATRGETADEDHHRAD